MDFRYKQVHISQLSEAIGSGSRSMKNKIIKWQAKYTYLKKITSRSKKRHPKSKNYEMI